MLTFLPESHKKSATSYARYIKKYGRPDAALTLSVSYGKTLLVMVLLLQFINHGVCIIFH